MTASAHDLFGSTSMQGSIPGACMPGPVFHEDGRLVLSESFTALVPRDEARKALAPYRNDWPVEAWRIWDCGESCWAACNLVAYRLECADIVVRDGEDAGVCVWTGALDVRARVLASRNPEENEACWWQWLRDNELCSLPEL